MTSRDTLAAAIIRVRKRHGSQMKLAETLGVTDRTVKRWEKGAVPNGESREKLIELGVDAALFVRADEREEIESRLRALEGQIAQIRASLD